MRHVIHPQRHNDRDLHHHDDAFLWAVEHCSSNSQSCGAHVEVEEVTWDAYGAGAKVTLTQYGA